MSGAVGESWSNNLELKEKNEKQLLKDETKWKDEAPVGCCRSKHTRNCCIATGIFGCIFLVLGVVVMLAGGPMLKKKIAASMALVDGSDRYESWLRPPVQPHLTAYAFHVTNPEAVKAGKKPIVKEVGPFVYKSKTLKDADDNVKWWGDATLTYRPRKLYSFEPALSTGGDPDTTMITVPNIPYWTGMNKARKKAGYAKSIAHDLVTGNGLGKPFIEVSFSGLLWGYEDELPCLKLDMPGSCQKSSPFGGSSDDGGFGGFGDDDDGFGGFGDDDDDGFGGFGDDDDDDFGGGFGEDDTETSDTIVEEVHDEVDEMFKPSKDSEWERMVKPKAEFVNCKCNWGLFRDRNITMRKPVRIHTGEDDMTKKGVVLKYDGKKTLDWWKKGSVCDKVKGQDSSTLPPNLNEDMTLEIYIALMCRTINLKYEKDMEHAGIRTLRFIPPPNAMGHHNDKNETMRNPDNECYCLEDEGFRCFGSGVTYMEPCKREMEAPLALSMPHFYQADPKFLEAVGGLNPEKEKHQFFMDVVPEFGFPLAIRPRFQLNVVISGDPGVEEIKNIPQDLVLPFLWAQDGFDEPSEIMAKKIAFGLAAPEKLPMLGSVIFFVIGAILLLTCLGYFFWLRRSASHTIKDSS